MAKFCKVGNERIRVAGDEYTATTVVSPDAIYMAVGQKTTMLGNHFGAVGALISLGIDKLLSKSQLHAIDIAELPAEVVADPEWPLKKKKSGQVVVIPRTVVESLRLKPWYNSLLRIETVAETFDVIVGLWTRAKARRFLTEHGWSLEG